MSTGASASAPPPVLSDAARRRRRRRRLVFALLVLAAVGWGGVRSVKNARWEPPPSPLSSKYEKRHRKDGSDFTCYYSAGELARKGLDIYNYRGSSTPTRQYIYPPLFAVFPMAPLSFLPQTWAAGVYYVLNVLLLAVVFVWLRELLWPRRASPRNRAGTAGTAEAVGASLDEEERRRRANVGLFFALLLSLRFIENNLRSGNANLVVLFLLTWALKELAARRDFRGGLATALATAVKVSPGLFGLYLLWSRRWKALLGGAVGLMLFLLVIPSAALGPQRNWEMLERFYGLVVAPTVQAKNRGPADSERTAGGKPYVTGISLRGTLMKLLSPVVALRKKQAVNGRRTVNIVAWSPVTARRAADAAALAVLVCTVLLTLRRKEEDEEDSFAGAEEEPAGRPARTDRLAAAWGLTTTAMLLIAPITRKGHLTLVLLPCAVLIAFLQRGLLTSRARRFVLASLWVFAAAVLLSAPELYKMLLGKRTGEVVGGHVHACGTLTAGLLVLFAGNAAALRHCRKK